MRKTIQVKIEDSGTPLEFEVTQMSATQAERWIMRSGVILARGISAEGGDITTALDALAKDPLKVIGGLDVEEAEPLLDALLGCCSRVIGSVREKCTPESVDAYVSDFTTLFKLRIEAFKLNFSDFFNSAAGKAAILAGESNSRAESTPPPTLKIPRG